MKLVKSMEMECICQRAFFTRFSRSHLSNTLPVWTNCDMRCTDMQIYAYIISETPVCGTVVSERRLFEGSKLSQIR